MDRFNIKNMWIVISVKYEAKRCAIPSRGPLWILLVKYHTNIGGHLAVFQISWRKMQPWSVSDRYQNAAIIDTISIRHILLWRCICYLVEHLSYSNQFVENKDRYQCDIKWSPTMKSFWYYDIHSQIWSFDCNVWLPNNRLEGHLSCLELNTGTVHGVDCLLVNCHDNYVHIWRFISNIFIWWLNWRLRVTLTTQGPHEDIRSNFVIWGDFKSSFRQKGYP